MLSEKQWWVLTALRHIPGPRSHNHRFLKRLGDSSMNHDQQINKNPLTTLPHNIATVLRNCSETRLVYGQPATGGQPGCRLLLLPPEPQQKHYFGQICLPRRPGPEAAELEFTLCSEHGEILECGPVQAGGSLKFPWREALRGQNCILRLQPAKVNSANTELQESHTDSSTANQTPHITFTNSIGLTMLLLPPDILQQQPASIPRHTACWISATLVSRRQWQWLMAGRTVARIHANLLSDQQPATNLSWFDAVAFCNRLSEQEQRHYRLPTVADWDCVFQLLLDNHTPPLHQTNNTPSVFELFHMHGNVWEWCSDTIQPHSSPTTQHSEPPSATSLLRLLRGGSWYNDTPNSRSAASPALLPGPALPPETAAPDIGFRLCCNTPLPHP